MAGNALIKSTRTEPARNNFKIDAHDSVPDLLTSNVTRGTKKENRCHSADNMNVEEGTKDLNGISDETCDSVSPGRRFELQSPTFIPVAKVGVITAN